MVAAAAAAATVASTAIGAATSGGQSETVETGRQEANAAQAQALAQAREDLSPWRMAGAGALSRMNALLGLPGGDVDQAAAFDLFRQTPGYGFAMSEGQRAVDTGAAARGLLRSGATLRAEQQFGQGLADQTFGNYYNRLLGLSQQGLTAGTSLASAALETGKGVAQTNASAAGTQANLQGQLGQTVQSGIGSMYGAGGGSAGWNRLFGGGGTINASAGFGSPNQMM